jgi:hypothetical protein
VVRARVGGAKFETSNEGPLCRRARTRARLTPTSILCPAPASAGFFVYVTRPVPSIASATMGSAAAPGRCRHLPTMMVRCVVGAVARALTPPSPAPTFRLRDMAAFRLSKHGGALASATRGSAANPDGAVDPRRSVLPSLTALARAVIAFGYTTARGRVDYNQKSSIQPYLP